MVMANKNSQVTSFQVWYLPISEYYPARWAVTINWSTTRYFIKIPRMLAYVASMPLSARCQVLYCPGPLQGPFRIGSSGI